MIKYGEKHASGFTNQDVINFCNNFLNSEIYNLSDIFNMNDSLPECLIGIVRNPFPELANDLADISFNENEFFNNEGYLQGLIWDKKKFMRGSVKNSLARYNLCFSKLSLDQYKVEPNYENGIGTLYNTNCIYPLLYLQNTLEGLVKSTLFCEGNYYYDSSKCYISYHCDDERKKVIGYRVGCNMDLWFRLHDKKSKNKVNDGISFNLNHGDLYIMSEFAKGDKSTNCSLFIKHAAGNPKMFIN